jgi:hypothetical protein
VWSVTFAVPVTAQVASTHSSGAGEQIFVVVASALIVAFITWFVRRVSKRENKRTADMQELKRDMAETKAALIGEPVSPLNPYPRKGVLQRLNELWTSHNDFKREVNRRLDSLATGAKEIKGDTAALVHESKTNQGSSMRDAIDENRAAIGEVRTEQTRVRDEHDNEQKGL